MPYRKQKIHKIFLSEEQRENLLHQIATGRLSSLEIKRAYVLLYADEGPMGPNFTDAEISLKIDMHRMTIVKVRQRFLRQGLDNSLITIQQGKNQVSGLDDNQLFSPGQEWLPMKTAEALFGLPTKGLYRLIRRGILKQIKLINRRIHVSRIELERFIALGEDSPDQRCPTKIKGAQ